MKRFLILLATLFYGAVFADTINLHWKNYDGTTYEDSTCVIDSDLILPSTPPTRYGYTFTGWKIVSYIPIEYLESTGTQYIDTGYIPNSNTRVKTKIKYNNVANNYTMAFVCGSWNTEGKAFGLFAWDRKLEFVRDANYRFGTTVSVGDIVELDYNKETVEYSVNNVKQTSLVFAYTVFTSLYQMRLFANNTGATPTSYGILNMYYLQIYDNDILVRDFIPVLDYNGIPCMYDKVTQQFFYNQGTGNFIAGPTL